MFSSTDYKILSITLYPTKGSAEAAATKLSNWTTWAKSTLGKDWSQYFTRYNVSRPVNVKYLSIYLSSCEYIPQLSSRVWCKGTGSREQVSTKNWTGYKNTGASKKMPIQMANGRWVLSGDYGRSSVTELAIRLVFWITVIFRHLNYSFFF